MLGWLARWLWLFWCWVELAVVTAILYLLAFLPSAAAAERSILPLE